MTMLKQSTVRTILVGPVLDADGAAKTDEVVANIRVTKNGTVGSADGSATLTHDHAGKYKLALTANDVDTLGVLEISLTSGTNDMPVRGFNVVPANVFDSLVSGDDYLDISLKDILGTALTESVGGYIAAAVKKLFDVATPLLVASDVMRGTDGANTTVPDAAGVVATALGTLQTHGDGTWATATGFAEAGDQMALTDAQVTALVNASRDAILNRVLAGNHDTAGTPGKVLQDVAVAGDKMDLLDTIMEDV